MVGRSVAQSAGNAGVRPATEPLADLSACDLEVLLQAGGSKRAPSSRAGLAREEGWG